MNWTATIINKQLVGDNIIIQVEFSNGDDWDFVKVFVPYTGQADTWMDDNIQAVIIDAQARKDYYDNLETDIQIPVTIDPNSQEVSIQPQIRLNLER